MEMVGKFAKV